MPARRTRWRARRSPRPCLRRLHLDRARRRHGAYRAVEFSARHGDSFAGAGACGRLHGGVKPAEQSPLSTLRLPSSPLRPVFRPASSMSSAASAQRRGRRSSTSAGAGDQLHRLGRGRPRDHGRGGAGLKPAVLELGGKNAADRLRAMPILIGVADDMLAGAFDNSGQVCSACSRILVDPIADDFGERLAARAARIRRTRPR